MILVGERLFLSDSSFHYMHAEIRTSQRIVLGCLSAISVAVYLVILGSIIDSFRVIERGSHILGSTVFASASALLAYLSPTFRARIENLLTESFPIVGVATPP